MRRAASGTAAERERRLRDQLFRRTIAASGAASRKRASDRRAETMRARGERTTEMLSTLVNRMSEQVEHSEQTTAALLHSSSVLRDSHSNFTAVGNTIRSGGKLISKYGRRETTDKILIVLCLVLYFGVCLYILRKRIPRLAMLDWWYWFG